MTTTTLVLGGARSGKSRYAEMLLADEEEVTYIAPAPGLSDDDPEWQMRVKEHQQRRPESWTTVESIDVTRSIVRSREPVLVDCLGTWVTSIIDDADAWQDRERAMKLIIERTEELVAIWTIAPYNAVAVSNEVGSGVVPETASGRLFQDALGRVNAMMSAASNRVHLVVAGRVLDISDMPVVPGLGV